MRTLVAIVVRLLRRLKKPSRNDDYSQPINSLKSHCHLYWFLWNKFFLEITILLINCA